MLVKWMEWMLQWDGLRGTMKHSGLDGWEACSTVRWMEGKYKSDNSELVAGKLGYSSQLAD